MKGVKTEDEFIAQLEEKIVARLQECPQGIDPDEFRDLADPVAVTKAFNSLMTKNRLRMFVGGPQQKKQLCQLAPEAWTLRFRHLSPDEKRIYYDIEASGRKGVWIRDLRKKHDCTHVQKGVKKLEEVGLVKQISPWDHPTRKVYMLAELEPLKSTVGSSWFLQGGALDNAFVDVLRDWLTKKVKQCGHLTAARACQEAISAGILQVDVPEDEMRTLLKTLEYDGTLECYMDLREGEVFATAPKGIQLISPYTQVPCGVCPVASECTPDGLISPATCVYFKEYLDF